MIYEHFPEARVVGGKGLGSNLLVGSILPAFDGCIVYEDNGQLNVVNAPSERVGIIIVDDVLSTGKALGEAATVLTQYGEVLGGVVIVDRSEELGTNPRLLFNHPIYSIFQSAEFFS